MATQAFRRDIVAGPGRFELAVYGPQNEKSMDSQPRVVFTITDGTKSWQEHVRILTIGREDGSGRNFTIDGYTTDDNERVEIYYSLRRQRGTMTFNHLKLCTKCGRQEHWIANYCSNCGTKL